MQEQLPSDSVPNICRADVLGYSYRLTQPSLENTRMLFGDANTTI